MNKQPGEDLETWDTKVAPKIPCNDVVSSSLPFPRRIERLVDVAIKPKRFFPNGPIEF